jgi:hypothetical protein
MTAWRGMKKGVQKVNKQLLLIPVKIQWLLIVTRRQSLRLERQPMDESVFV